MIHILLLVLAGCSRLEVFNSGITEESCNKYDINGWKNLNDAYQDTHKCIVNEGIDFESIREISSEKHFSQFIKRRCASRDQVDNCINKLFTFSEKCLSKTELNSFNAWKKIDDDMMNYICHNEAKIENSGLDEICLYDGFNNALQSCSQDLFQIMSNSNDYNDILKVSCSKFEDLKRCLTNKLPEYCNKNSVDLFTSAIGIIKFNACDNSVQEISHKRYTRSIRAHRVVRDIITSEHAEKVEMDIKTMCKEKGHSHQELEDKVNNMKICMKKEPIFITPKIEYIKHLDNCTKDVATFFKDCLPDKYKYIPHLFVDIMNSMISFLYDDFLLIGGVITPCLDKITSTESQEEYHKCLKNVSDSIPDKPESRKVFCTGFEKLNACYLTQVKKHCKPSPDLTKFETDFKAAYTRPCEKK